MKYCLIFSLTLLISGCGLLPSGTSFKQAATAQTTTLQTTTTQKNSHQLYHSIGGDEGIERITDAFIKQIARDPDILPYFAKSLSLIHI